MISSSNGKLLITAEYLVLDGAKSLALPTAFGQQLSIEANDSKTIIWKSFDETNSIWFKDEFKLEDGKIKNLIQDNIEVSERLIQILKAAQRLNSEFLKAEKGLNKNTTQDFNRKWGLGTSSTLINNIANWAKVDAYKLLELTFGGSGYDIACAQNDTAITYQIINKKPQVESLNFNPSFKNNIYFVYLNQKQNSRDGIAAYRNYEGNLSESISQINAITQNMLSSQSLNDFETLVENHEKIISKIIGLQPVKAKLFSDFNGSVKSLGAWGGDFVMVTSKENPSAYFKVKGYDTIIPYSKMIKA